MRIAYVSNSTIPSEKANAVHVMKMCNALSKNNIDVELYCNSTVDNFDEVFKKYGVENTFNIIGVKQPKGLISKIPNSLYLAYKTYKKIRIRGQKIDYLYGRSVYGIFLLRNHYQYIYESHMPPRKGLLTYLETRILKNKNCKNLVVISSELKKKYMNLFPWLEEEKIIVLHDSADEKTENRALSNSIEQEKRLDISCGDVVIGYLGHLYPGKVMEVVIPIAQKRSDYNFHIVGGTQEWIKFWKDKIIELKLDNVKFYGFVDNNTIGYYYDLFDIMLLPFSKKIYIDKNKKDDIGSWISPLKLFEAMSYSKAILASELPTIKEVLSDGNDALLANPEDIDEWCIKLDNLVKSKDLRFFLGENAHEKFTKYYTWNIRAEKVHSLFKGVKPIEKITS